MCLTVWLLALQRDALACVTATADAPWTWTAGTASASWAGGERAATLPWRRRAATGKTTTEVGHERMWHVRLRGGCKPSEESAGLDSAGQIVFLTAGGEQTAMSARLTQAGWILNSYGMGLDLGCQGWGGGLVCPQVKSVHQRAGRGYVIILSPRQMAQQWHKGTSQTANAPKHSNFGLSDWGFQQSSLVGHYWLGMDVLQKLRGFCDWSPCPQAIQSLSNHVLLITVPYIMMSGMWIIALRNANLIFRVISLQRKAWCSVKVWIRGQEMRY